MAGGLFLLPGLPVGSQQNILILAATGSVVSSQTCYKMNAMPEPRPLTLLCITTYEKGQDFMRECKRQGCHVILLTAEKLRWRSPS